MVLVAELLGAGVIYISRAALSGAATPGLPAEGQVSQCEAVFPMSRCPRCTGDVPDMLNKKQHAVRTSGRVPGLGPCVAREQFFATAKPPPPSATGFIAGAAGRARRVAQCLGMVSTGAPGAWSGRATLARGWVGRSHAPRDRRACALFC